MSAKPAAGDPARRDAWALEEAQGFLELNLPARALAALERVSPAGRETFGPSMARATALMALQRHDDAIPHLLHAKALNPKAIPVLVALGWCCKRSDQLPRAIAELHLAERLARQRRDDPSRALAMYNLSCYYCLALRKAECLHWLELALHADAKYRKLALAEADFATLHDDPHWQLLVTGGPTP